MNWAAVDGVRMKRFLVTCRENGEVIVILAIAIEPVRYLTEHFIRGTAENPNRKTPAIFKFLNWRTSPVTAVLSYCSSLLMGEKGECSRLLLLWKAGGFASFSDWARARPSLARRLRDSILVVSAWTDDRHRLLYEDSELEMLMLGDSRRTVEEREACVRRFKFNGGTRKRLCCVPFGWRHWQERPDESLLGIHFACVSFRTASMTTQTIGDIECRHARNRRGLRAGQSWHAFAAEFTNKESKAVTVVSTKRFLDIPSCGPRSGGARRRALSDRRAAPIADAELEGAHAVGGAGPGDAVVAPCLPESLKWLSTTRKKLPPLQVLRMQVLAERRAAGECLSASSPVLWDMVRRRWENLQDEDRAELERTSNLSAATAEVNRLKHARASLGSSSSVSDGPSAEAPGSSGALVWRSGESAGQLALAPKPPELAIVQMVQMVGAARRSVEDAERRPMPLALFEQVVAKQNVTSLVNTFQEKVTYPCADKTKTDRVVYHQTKHCGSLCKEHYLLLLNCYLAK